RHAGLDHVGELAGVVAVRVDAGVGAEGDLHAVLVGAAEGGEDPGADVEGLGRHLRRVGAGHPGVGADGLAGDGGGHEPGAVLLHQLHVWLVHEGAVLDRVDAADHGAADRLGAVGVGGDGEAVVVRGGDHRLDLLLGHLRVVGRAGFVEHAAGRHDLDQVGAVLVVLAHRLPGVRRAVDDALLRAGIAGEVGAVAVGGTGVAAGGADVPAGAVDA